MNIEANVLQDVSVDTDIKGVAQIPGTIYLEYIKTSPQVSVAVQPFQLIERPIYCISDLHLGDGGPRDNFLPEKEKQLFAFLDYVEAQHGELLILGDLFEMWQANWSRIFTTRERLLDRFAAMGATYILGNHDADLFYFQDTPWLNHPLFRNMVSEVRRTIRGRSFQFCHGHQADEYCSAMNPGLGRITAIYTGLKEDRHGGPMLDKYRTIEQKYLRPLEWVVSVLKRLCGKPDRFTEINQLLMQKFTADYIIFGHTHSAGHVQHGGRYLYNTGTWAERTNSFVRVDQSVTVWDWDFGAIPCERTLPI